MTQQTDHLDLWKQVEKTPTTAVKPANVNGQNITAIDTMHMVKLATKVFGPAGIGWGYSIDEDRFDQGAPVLLKEQVIGYEQTHTCRLTLWYQWNDKRGEVTQYGHTRAVYMTNKGKFITDGEAPKKSVTDAMKKCLSQLGFAADIFTGLFDDVGYRQLREAETRLEAAEDFDAELQKYRDEYTDWLNRECDALLKIPYQRSVEIASERLLQRINDKASVARVDPAKGVEKIRRTTQTALANLNQQQEPAHG